MFTAVVVLQLVAEHRIELDGAVQRYLPGLLPPDYPTVTVRQLLDHTSGLPSPVLADESVEYQVTGNSYEDEVRDRVVRPLRLTGTSVPGDDPAIRGRHVHGYQVMTDGTLRDVTRWNQSFGWAASAVISTTGDLDIFTQALLGGRLLPPEVQRELFAVPAVPGASYGVGLQRFVLPGVGEVWARAAAGTATSPDSAAPRTVRGGSCTA